MRDASTHSIDASIEKSAFDDRKQKPTT